MAAYMTLFACTLPLDSADNARPALDLYLLFAEELRAEGEPVAFEVRLDPEGDGTELILSSGAGSGDPDQVMAFVGRCGPALGLSGRWGFTWAETGDQDCPDGFGGGAVVLDLASGEVVASLDCDSWLAARLGSQPVPPCPASRQPASGQMAS